jgi:hypothetical protein
MADQDNIWFRLGYTLESVAQRSRRPPRLRSLVEREPERAEPRAARKVGAPRMPRPEPVEERASDVDVEDAELDAAGGLAGFLKSASPTGEPWEAVISAVGAALVGRLLDAMPRQRRPGPIRLLHAAAAGAGAAIVRELLQPVTGVTGDRPLADRARGAALTGSARGLLYGALVEPRLPGPPVIRGALYGCVEHLVSPMGGLITLAGARAPHRSLPFVSALFDELEQSDDETFLDHVLFGIGLAALYGARPADVDEDDEEADEDED